MLYKIIAKTYSQFCDLDTILQKISDKTKTIILGLCSLGLFMIILKLNIMTPLWADDFFYSLTFSGGHINSFQDILLSQYQHYFQWGGRSVVHSIAQLLLVAPPIVADLINSLVFVLFIILIYFHARGNEKRHSISLFILIFISQWFIQPAFGETVLWLTGSSNYLFGMFIVLIFMLPYRLYRNKDENKKMKAIGFFIFGIVAGWTNENISIALIMMTFLYLLYWKRMRFRIPYWAIWGLVGTIVGCLILILAPGNFIRASTVYTNHSLFAYYYKFNIFTHRFMDNLGYLNIITSILLILVLKFAPISRMTFLGSLFIYILGVLVSIYSMLLSPTFPGRAWFGIITLNIVVFSLVFYKLDNKLNFIRYIKYLILSIAIIAFCFDFYVSYKDIKKANVAYNERKNLIEQAIDVKKVSVTVQSIPSNSKFVLGDNSFVVGVMSNYYGISIIME